MKLWLIHARSIYRKSRADVGKAGLWLVEAKNADAATIAWQDNNIATGGEWVHESTVPNDKAVRRIL